jgi:sorbitol-specific phosphotransferase system component IIBC
MQIKVKDVSNTRVISDFKKMDNTYNIKNWECDCIPFASCCIYCDKLVQIDSNFDYGDYYENS